MAAVSVVRVIAAVSGAPAPGPVASCAGPGGTGRSVASVASAQI
jgi:hypothetical protein